MPKILSPTHAALLVSGPDGTFTHPLENVKLFNNGYATEVSGHFLNMPKPYSYPSTTTNSTNFKKAEPVANTYDKQDDKNAAIGQISASINKLEVALFTRNRRMAEVERDQDGLVTQASFNLDSALAQALQEGVTVEDLEQHFPEHSDVLENRVDGIVQITTLDMLDVLV